MLEPLSGYLLLAEQLYNEGQPFAEGWNFGPHEEDARPVQWIVERMVETWGGDARWQLDGGTHPHEANHLKLDISKARARLDWQPRWDLTAALERITDWHHTWLNKANVQDKCLQQIVEYQTNTN